MSDELKARLKNILLMHKGRNSAITRRELRFKLDYQNDRKLRIMITELRSEGVPILFATDKPAGYYIPATREELQKGLDQYRSYIVDLCAQRACVKNAGFLLLKPAKQGVLI